MESGSVFKKHKLNQAVKEQLPRFTKTNTVLSIGTALLFLAVLVTNSYLLSTVSGGGWYFPLVALLSIRSLRALENLGGHEGAHKNWVRNNRKLNDFLANAFAGWWVFTSAQAFRKTHVVHHSNFGAPPDPCFTRYSMFRFAQMRAQGRSLFLKALLHEYFPYIRDYWVAYSFHKRFELVIGLLLHTTLVLTGTLIWPHFLMGWLLAVLLPFLFLLPIFRMWAEAEEHDYDGKAEFEDTYNNLSFFSRWFLHPAGDAYHLLHHTIPTVPHFRMPYVHRQLLKLDPEYCHAEKTRT